MKEKFTEQVRQVVNAAIQRCGSAYALYKSTGCSQSNIGRWKDGKSYPNSKDVAPIMDFMGAHIVMPGEQEIEYDYVPKHAARAGAGASLETSGETVGMYAFRKEWMASMGIYASSAVLLDVIGDSMEPLFYEGDTILVDKHDHEIREGKIYVVTLGDELRVKRIYKGISGLILRSENQRYPDVQVTGPDLETFIVHGRVRWCGKIL